MLLPVIMHLEVRDETKGGVLAYAVNYPDAVDSAAFPFGSSPPATPGPPDPALSVLMGCAGGPATAALLPFVGFLFRRPQFVAFVDVWVRP
jgi:hypothetical protein